MIKKNIVGNMRTEKRGSNWSVGESGLLEAVQLIFCSKKQSVNADCPCKTHRNAGALLQIFRRIWKLYVIKILKEQCGS